MDKNLRIEQILCLQLSGYSAVEIFGMSQTSFHRIYSTHENIKASFTTARCILEGQERLGILTLPFHHPDFPESLRMIEADCPPLIHLFAQKYGKQIYAVRFGQYDMQKSSGNEQLINDGVAIPL